MQYEYTYKQEKQMAYNYAKYPKLKYKAPWEKKILLKLNAQNAS